MSFFAIKKPLIRLGLLFGILLLAWWLWQPGTMITDGRHDVGKNAIWMQHGWLGDNEWFEKYDRNRTTFRDPAAMATLAKLYRSRGIRTVYPHLCPCSRGGILPGVHAAQTEAFLDAFDAEGIAVVPWIGGVRNKHCFVSDPAWRSAFVTSAVALLKAHPRLAGVQVNIEPMRSGTQGFVELLRELRAAMFNEFPEVGGGPKNGKSQKRLSVAAYPPPTRWHPHEDVHWEEAYFRKVTAECDEVAVMMYDTAIRIPKFYEKLMADWTEQVIQWSPGTDVFLGLPTYNDEGVGYHHPHVENLEHGLRGIHAGLSRFDSLPTNYQGVALYCEWETDEKEWNLFDQGFRKNRKKN